MQNKEEPRYYIPMDPVGIYWFGPKLDRYIAVCALLLVGGITYATRNDKVVTYTSKQLPQLHQAFSSAGEGRCVVRDHNGEVMFFEKKTSLKNCFEGTRAALTPDKAEPLSFGLKDAEGKNIAFGRCIMNSNVPQGHCSVEMPGAGKPGDITYKISL